MDFGNMFGNGMANGKLNSNMDTDAVKNDTASNVLGGVDKVLNAEKYIEDITIVSGKQGVSTPSGYTKIDVDLNMGAGGNYIYACVKRGGNADNAITGLAVVEGKKASAPAGFEKIDVDLNEKAGGKYLYLCKKRGGGGKALEDVTAVYGDNANVDVPSGYTKLDRDLNEKAGGKYIYLCYK